MRFIRHFLTVDRFLRKFWPMNVSNIPLVVIIGSTGTGKTKLSLEIAKKFNGEIISADSMQVYKGLDIVTNKATPEERQQIPHYMIDFLDPLSRFTVVDFRKRALNIINDLISNNKLPIVVGGTNYYIESILWEVLVLNEDMDEGHDKQCLVYDRDLQLSRTSNSETTVEEITKEIVFSSPISYDRFEDVSSEKLYEILKEIDPDSALNLHPNNKRKIIRCLQVYQQNGRLYSEIIADQKSLTGGSELGGPLRFKNSVILWLDCDKKVLDERLDNRVDDMIEKGLINELLDFHKRYNSERLKQNLNADYTKGIFQSIGFKEFHNYLLLNEEQITNPKSQKLLSEGVEAMKLRTKKYVNQQIKWIRNRFLRLNKREVPNIYRLNTTNIDEWTEQVTEPSFAIVKAYSSGTSPPNNLVPLTKIEMKEHTSSQFYCDICQKILSGSLAYELHLTSKGHKYKQKHQINLKKQKYYELLTLLKSHRNNLIRRNSI